VLGEAPRWPQATSYHLPGPLLLRLPTRTLPDPYYRRSVSGHEALHALYQIILEARAAKLPVCEDIDTNAALTL
jgi:hypothetical protein